MCFSCFYCVLIGSNCGAISAFEFATFIFLCPEPVRTIWTSIWLICTSELSTWRFRLWALEISIMKFQLLAFIFPTLACVLFLLAASWFLFALFGPLIFTSMLVQLLTSFYLKILYSILSLSRALSGLNFPF